MNIEMVNRADVEYAQREVYGDADSDSGFGEGPMQDALIRFRQELALRYASNNGPNIDLGCGHTLVCQALQQEAFPVLGVDLMAERLVRHKDVVHSDHAHLLQGRAQEIPFPDNLAPRVFAFELFEHLSPEDSISMLGECHRVLSPGGRLILTTPNTSSAARKLKSMIQRFLPNITDISLRSDHFNEVDVQTLQQLCANTGFNPILVQGIGLIPGMWRIQNYIPSKRIHDLNVRAGRLSTLRSGETLYIGEKSVE